MTVDFFGQCQHSNRKPIGTGFICYDCGLTISFSLSNNTRDDEDG